MFYSNDIAKIFPQIGTVLKKTTFPKATTYSRLFLYTVQLWIISQWSIQSTSHTTFLLIWIWEQHGNFCILLGSGKDYKRFSDRLLHQLVTGEQTSRAERDEVPGSDWTALRGTTLRWLCFVLCSLSIPTVLLPSPSCAYISTFSNHWLLPRFEGVFCSVVGTEPELIKVSLSLCTSAHTISGETTQTELFWRGKEEKPRRIKLNVSHSLFWRSSLLC